MSQVAVQTGTLIWSDLASPDLEASKKFYSGLFGWEVQTLGPDAGGYMMLTLGGKNVVGLGPQQNPQQPPAWLVYLATDDADAIGQKVRDAGGQTLAEPFDVLNAGRMAIFQDPGGAVFGVWQPGQHRGAELMNQPGTISWPELSTRDPEGAKRFYPRVFGWEIKDSDYGDSTYTEWQIGGRSVAGMMPMSESIPAQVPPHWLLYFAVQDCRQATQKVQELGGRVLVETMEYPGGTFAVAADPQGATFGLMAGV